MLIVGAGSSLLKGGVEFLSPNSETMYMSRSKPDFVEDGSWIQTDYNPQGNSITELGKVQGITNVVWLASPLYRGLFVNQKDELVTESLVFGALFQTLLIKSLLPEMVRSRFGRFVFAGSSGAKLGSPGALTYMQTKAAQSALSKGLAMEYGGAGITSNVVNIGVLHSGYSSGLPPEVITAMLARTPGARRIATEDFWKLVSHIIANPSINGAEIALDGGYG